MTRATVDELLQDAGSRKARRRMAALTSLSREEDPRVEEALLASLRDRSHAVRCLAVSALINRDRDRDIQVIVEALRGHTAVEWRPPDATEILEFGILYLTQANAAEVLGEAVCTSDDTSLRHSAVIALGQLRDARAVPALIQALSDPLPHVRREAARSLGHIRDPRAIRPPLGVLDDPYRAVRRVAGRALAKIGVAMREVLRFRSQTEPGRQGRRRLLRRVLLRKLLFFRR